MCATVAWILVGCAGSPDEAERERDSTLRAELLELYEEDQQAREGFGAAAAAQDTVFMKRLMAGDSVRSTRLHEILTATGWPTVAQVDSDGVHAAWMLLQHSPSVEMQAEWLPEIDSAAARGEVPRADVAMMTDRILVRQGKPQRYGTSFSVVDGKLVLDPVERFERLVELRASVGLPPMAEYVRVLEEAYGLPAVWPPTTP